MISVMMIIRQISTILLALAPLTAALDLYQLKCDTKYQFYPECIDSWNGYRCYCGPGFKWNSNSSLCCSYGADSKLAFPPNADVSYAILTSDGKPKEFEKLNSFTITVWVRASPGGAVVSYGNRQSLRDMLMLVDERRKVLSIEFQKVVQNYSIPALNSHYWFYIAWTHQNVTNKGGVIWSVYINSTITQPTVGTPRASSNGFISTKQLRLDARGELILGQSERYAGNKSFNHHYSFLGDIAHFNMWDEALTAKNIRSIFRDCALRFCGNFVEWINFRSGTRGDMKLKWPSGIYASGEICGNAADDSISQMKRSCDISCSKSSGVRCKQTVKMNILWKRTSFNQTCKVPCPGSLEKNKNATKFAYRTCGRSGLDGRWLDPNVSECYSHLFADVIAQVNNFASPRDERGYKSMTFRRNKIIRKLDIYLTAAKDITFDNPIDLTHQIEHMKALIVDWIMLSKNGYSYRNPHIGFLDQAQASIDDGNSLEQCEYFFKTILEISDHLLSIRNVDAWNKTSPPGREAAMLAETLKLHFNSSILIFYDLMMSEKSVTHSRINQLLAFTNIVVKLRIYRVNDFVGEALPDEQDSLTLDHLIDNGVIGIQKDLFRENNSSTFNAYFIAKLKYQYVIVLTAVFPTLTQYMLSMESLTGETGNVGNDDLVNSAAFFAAIFLDDRNYLDLEVPIRVKLMFKNNHNISDVTCVQLNTDLPRFNMRVSNPFFHGVSPNPSVMPSYSDYLKWFRYSCVREDWQETYVICSCNKSGFFAVTTDMYNPNYTAQVIRPLLVEAPSYVGCCVSILLCFLSFCMLTYYRTSSNTASIHKNFSLAIVGGKMAFIIGIDQYDHKDLCHAFTVLLHYFFLASMSWLMNEAFNLYIVITYAAHSHGDHTDGSMWRYYLLGWIFPGILVGTFLCILQETYYDPNMCWIKWPNQMWIFFGPAISILVITILVLTFTAKEHHESSYTKNEEANRTIVIQTKALWTQVILLSTAWAFAFTSIMWAGVIVKYLYMVFNCLQGMFFIVFYFLLNEEVMSIHNEGQNRRGTELASGTAGDEDNQSMESLRDGLIVNEKANDTDSLPMQKTDSSSNNNKALECVVSHVASVNGSENDDTSDCEMIVTSV